MKLLKKTVLLVISASFILSAFDSFSGELYKWIDEKDFLHFSDTFPDGDNVSPILSAAGCAFIIKGGGSVGTGFFISPNGYAITCKHVLEDGHNYMAILRDRKEFAIGVIAASESYDLALILVTTPQKTPYLSFRDPLSMVSGERVYAIGSSSGLQSTVTYGIFNCLREQIPDNNLIIQFSAPVDPGNSGGPLIDKNGKAIGVVSWKLVSDKGIPVTGVGFAVPLEYLIEEYKAYME
jgi:S1-C subfamily serine protease